MTAAKALFAQLAAWLIVVAAGAGLGHGFPPSLAMAAVQGVLAAALGALLRMGRWWLAIHLGFSPALLIALRLELPPAVPLVLLAALTLVFWTTFRGDVPLFLSNRATAQALVEALPHRAGLRFIDLGAGTGGLLRRLAAARPDASFSGVEHAPLPFALARMRGRAFANLAIRRGDLWQSPLAGQDVVFAFLSPRAMPRLWDKARAEMDSGALLVSSSFPVPHVRPERIIDVPDRRATRLYLYRM